MKPKLLRLHPLDNVVVATAPIKAGTTLRLDRVKLEVITDVPMAGKVATRPIAEREKIIKFGHPIGHATRNIEPGEWVHTHNLASDYLPTPERPRKVPSGEALGEIPVPAATKSPSEIVEPGEALELQADLALEEASAEGSPQSGPVPSPADEPSREPAGAEEPPQSSQ